MSQETHLHRCGTAIPGHSLPKNFTPARFREMFIAKLLDQKDECDFSLHEFEIRSGGEIPLHIHQVHQEAVYILSGRARMVVGGKVHEAGPGFVGYGPRGVSLAVKNVGRETLHALAIFSPPFSYNDYLWPEDPAWPGDQSPTEPY